MSERVEMKNRRVEFKDRHVDFKADKRYAVIYISIQDYTTTYKIMTSSGQLLWEETQAADRGSYAFV